MEACKSCIVLCYEGYFTGQVDDDADLTVIVADTVMSLTPVTQPNLTNTLTQWGYKAGPSSMMLAQHDNNTR